MFKCTNILEPDLLPGAARFSTGLQPHIKLDGEKSVMTIGLPELP
jgi:hypothetical protein